MIFTYPTVKDLVLGNFLSFPLRGELDDDKPSEMFSREFEEIFFSRVWVEKVDSEYKDPELVDPIDSVFLCRISFGSEKKYNKKVLMPSEVNNKCKITFLVNCHKMMIAGLISLNE